MCEHELIFATWQPFIARDIKTEFFFSFTGPEKWPELFPMASGHRQSPVNIDTKITTRSSTLNIKKPLSWKYIPENTRSLVNPGYCWRVDVNGAGSELTGGPLTDDKYMLEQFHCHWGCSDGKGIMTIMCYCYRGNE